MKLALIPPIALLDTTGKTGYELMLPQVASASAVYAKQYESLCKWPNNFVILDNGAAEGVETSVDVLLHMATHFRVNELVIPDVIGDAKATVEAALRFHDAVVPARHMRPLPFGLMFVIQGQTVDEVIACASWALTPGTNWIDTIGIPRHMLTTLNDIHARSKLANILSARPYCKPIHFLGANASNPMEIDELSDPKRTNQTYIRGMDTSMPYNYAFAGVKLERGAKRTLRPDNYFERSVHDFDRGLVEYNIHQLLHYVEA